MSYTPTNWTTGDTITATKLNKMEQGIADGGGGALIITDTNGTLDKTFAEIYDALANGVPCFVKYNNNTGTDLDEEYIYTTFVAPVIKLYKYDNIYRVYVATNTTKYIGTYGWAGTPALWTYSATDSQSYPTFYIRSFVNNNTTAVGADNDL